LQFQLRVTQPVAELAHDPYAITLLPALSERYTTPLPWKNMPSIEDFLSVCEKAVRTGGRLVQDWVGRAEVRTKGPADFVTQADLASQEAVRRTVLSAFPDHSLLGEEKSPGEVPAERTEYRWIVDPLDGTTNYVHGMPHYCVSLALERRGELLVGAVYDPIHDECFTASLGHGARLNGRPIHASSVLTVSESLAVVGFPYNVKKDSPDVRMFLEMLGRCHGIRRTGSTALNLAYMAAGWFDVYWSFSTNIWDVAAGVLLLREAGGYITSPTGSDFCLEKAEFLAAANRDLHVGLLEIAASLGTP
jgi:myo-inositol-1(or 4)-monophosphatase